MRMRNPKDKDEIISNCNYLIKEKKDLFDKSKPLYLEVGMGKGSFIINNALENPNINYIGLEKYSSVASIAIKKANEYNLDNLKIMIMDVNNSTELLKNKIDVIFLNFSDPWPKKRHAKRRLTSDVYLKVYDELFKDKKVIIMKTDNDDLFNYSLESFKDYGYKIDELSYDLHKENIVNIETEYEKKFSEEGIKIKYVKVSKE